MSDRYDELRRVLDDALEHASKFKGAERHDPTKARFEDQKIVQVAEWLQSTHGPIYQACKKSVESAGLPPDQARAELLGAINYLAAAVLVLDRQGASESADALAEGLEVYTWSKVSVTAGTEVHDWPWKHTYVSAVNAAPLGSLYWRAELCGRAKLRILGRAGS